MKSIDLLTAALAAAKLEFTPIVKDKLNKHFGARYASHGSVLAATEPALARHGLTLMQIMSGELTLVTLLSHSSGQWIRSETMLRPASTLDKATGQLVHTPQAIGSALTYFCRYTRSAMLGVDAEDDDDGQAASAEPKPQPKQQQEIKQLSPLS